MPLVIVNIIGARPQFIKYVPIHRELETRAGVREILIHTGQHYDYMLSKVFFDELGLKEPDYHLGVGSASHGKQTAQVIEQVEDILQNVNPDVVLVYGDTNSTIGGAFAAAKLQIPVAHVESGLRSFNKGMPEEVNRILTDHISTLLFCPSGEAVRNLRTEGFTNVLNNGERVGPGPSVPTSGVRADRDHPLVINAGDIMYDVLLHALTIARKRSTFMQTSGLTDGGYCLMTLHRAENTDQSEVLKRRLQFASETAGARTVIFPVHPRTRKVLERHQITLPGNIRMIDPLGYFDMLMALEHSAMLLTDSGGMQKEAYWLRIPCITLREETEWVETIASGWNVLSKNYTGRHTTTGSNQDIYGDGSSATVIIEMLKTFIV